MINRFVISPWHLVWCCLFTPLTLWAATEGGNQEHVTLERSRMQLNRTVRDLVREQLALNQAQGEAQSWLTELETLDRSLTDGERRYAELVMRQQEAQRLLPELESRINANRKELAKQRRRLAKHLRLMYGLGTQGAIKTFFSQENAALGRKSMLYYARLIKARNQDFQEFRIATARLRNDMAKSLELTATLATLNANLTEEQKIRQEERLKRAQFLERARVEEQQHQRKVEELTKAKLQLTTFLEKLSGVLDQDSGATDSASNELFVPADDLPQPPDLPASRPVKPSESSVALPVASRPVKPSESSVALPVVSDETSPPSDDTTAPLDEPAPPQTMTQAMNHNKIPQPAGQAGAGSGAGIMARRGHLRPPVKGPVEKRPPGIFYKILPKTQVTAIYTGQVVYADWFRGYGLLLILKHGDQVYSLYGHNSKILVAQGEVVQERQSIAESGDTGTLDGVPGLYFEIRIKGKTANPVTWLAGPA
ncbi:MAG: peptidoglycan DD-metalloendopeptidase family protein [Magnetococcus sp. YQC-5]